MTYEWDADQRAFLDAHLWAVLATGRADGSPQQSMVGYAVDDEGRLVLSVKSYTAKWKNALRQPKVSLTVVDGRQHLVIYGEVETIDADPLRAELSELAFRVILGNEQVDPVSMIPLLDEQQRTVLRLTPSRTVFI